MSGLFELLTGLRLQDPWLLLLWLLLPLVLWLRVRRGTPAVHFAPTPLASPGPLPAAEARDRTGAADPSLPPSWRMRLLPLPRGLQVLAILVAGLALARPVQRVAMPREVLGIDILLCLDVSSSMAATDLDAQRTRLDVAKEAAAEFIAERPHDRIGLIRFARYPDLLCPPTLDHRALADFVASVERVEPDGPEDMTGIGTAVARAAQVLRGSSARSKVLILLTDGEENVATSQTPDEIGPLRAGRLCQQLGVRAYTIVAGIGKQNRAGDWVPLDTTQVRRLAELTGGAFFEARDAGTVARIYATIDGLEKDEFAEPRFELEDRFLPLLLGAIGLMLMSGLLASTVLEVLP